MTEGRSSHPRRHQPRRRLDRPAVVVGGGITGLAAAYELTRAGVAVVLLEASDRLGGKLHTTSFTGQLVDEGADAFLARVPWATELCRELGLDEELVAPSTSSAYVWSRDALRRLPEGLLLGIPTDLDALARSGIVSPDGVARAARDLEANGPSSSSSGGSDNRDRRHDDESVGALVRRRLGDEVFERLVDPLLGGINAGDADTLSLRAGAPQLAAAAAASPSLIAGARSLRQPTASGADTTATRGTRPASPVFLCPRDGMGVIVDRLASELERAGVEIRLRSPVPAVELTGDRPFIVTTPAFVTAGLVAPQAPATAKLLRKIEYASVALVSFAFPAAAVRQPLDGSGFLVPRSEGLLMTACSWASTKWHHLGAAEPETVIFRVSAGRFGDTRGPALDDAALVAALRADLERTMGIDAPPSAVRISRWLDSFPQYRPGHLDLVDEIDEALAGELPNVVLAGAAYRGLGVPACIRQGREAARRLLDAGAGTATGATGTGW